MYTSQQLSSHKSMNFGFYLVDCYYLASVQKYFVNSLYLCSKTFYKHDIIKYATEEIYGSIEIPKRRKR